MKIEQITEKKKAYLELLLLGDEQEIMIDRYLERSDMFVLFDPDAVGECVVMDCGEGRFEIKNLAVKPEKQGNGYGSALVRHVLDFYADRCSQMMVGTGDSPLTIPFYERCGFREHHRIKNFFIDFYDHPIFEGGKQLVDMVYLVYDAGEVER